MTINELIAELRAAAAKLPPNYSTRATDATVACLDAEFDIDCIQVSTFEGRPIVRIRIEPDDER